MKMYEEPIPIGDRILIEVEVDPKKAVKSAYLVIPDSINEEHNKRALLSTTIGKILKLGSLALENALLTDTEKDLVPGDMVLFLQNAGVSFKHPDESKVYRLLTRGDIMALVGNAEEE